MKVTKHYEQDHVMVYVEEGDMRTCITLDSDRQMRRLGEGCDLARGEPNHIRAIPSVSRLGEANPVRGRAVTIRRKSCWGFTRLCRSEE